MEERGSKIWAVPYLPIDPADLGRKYEPIVRINSQSGKGGVAFVLEQYYGFRLPKAMHKELADCIQEISERQGEVSPSQIMDQFREMYINAKYPLHFKRMRLEDAPDSSRGFDTKVTLTYTFKDELRTVEGYGNGPIDAIKQGLNTHDVYNTRLTMYEEHALTTGSDSQAATYIELMNIDTGEKAFGVGISSNINRSSARAIFSALNRLYYRKH
jgi:2-isopropylmalate synthase